MPAALWPRATLGLSPRLASPRLTHLAGVQGYLRDRLFSRFLEEDTLVLGNQVSILALLKRSDELRSNPRAPSLLPPLLSLFALRCCIIGIV